MFVKKLYETVLRRKIARVNRHLATIRFRDKAVQEMYQYAVMSGGKRFRPLLVMLSCEAVGGDSKNVVPVAAAFELLHKASLMHDDLIDEDDYRRGRETFHKRYTKEKAVAMGDLLVAVAFDQLFRQRALLGERFVDCYTTFLATFRELALGELKEEVLRESAKVVSDDIEELHYQKTAVLIESCFRIGAIAGGGSRDEVTRLAVFGKDVGLIFQTVNDINNLDGLESKVKRELYTDVAKKRKSHMIAHALKTSPDKNELLRIFAKDTLSGDDVERILHILEANGSIDHAYRQIDSYLDDARQALSGLHGSPTKIVLSKLLDEAKSKWFWHGK